MVGIKMIELKRNIKNWNGIYNRNANVFYTMPHPNWTERIEPMYDSAGINRIEMNCSFAYWYYLGLAVA